MGSSEPGATTDGVSEAARARNQAIRRLSHDLRSPLGTLLLQADVLSRDLGLSADSRAALTKLERSGRQVVELLDRYVDFASVEAGEGELTPARVAIRPVALELVTVASATLGARGHGFHAHFEPVAPSEIWADETRVRQILHELMLNASRFATPGPIELGVGPGAPGRVLLTVTDAGPGIPEADRERAFEPFWRGKRVAGAAACGLGLAIGRKLAELMRGELRLEATPAGGCRFALELPER
jgi:signal transduction histidine kinase